MKWKTQSVDILCKQCFTGTENLCILSIAHDYIPTNPPPHHKSCLEKYKCCQLNTNQD